MKNISVEPQVFEASESRAPGPRILVPAIEQHSAYVARGSTKRYAWQMVTVGLPLAIADAVASFASVLIGLSVLRALDFSVNHLVGPAALAALVYSVSFWSAGLYPGIGWHPARELRQMARASAAGTAAMVIGLLFVSKPHFSAYFICLLAFLPLQLVLIPIVRSIAKSFMHRYSLGIPCYFLGTQQAVATVYRDMLRFGSTHLSPKGRFTEKPEPASVSYVPESDDFAWRFERDVPFRGAANRMVELAEAEQVYCLFIVGDNAAETVAKHSELLSIFPEIICARASRSFLCSGSGVVNYGLTSGIRIEETLLLPWPRFCKRAMDVVLAGLAIIALSPLFAFIALCIKLSSPGPVFFSHQRIGRGGKVFHAWKFRSMVPNANQVLDEYLALHPELKEEWDRDHKLKNDPRVTWIGSIIRKTSFDELPQLLNVLVGDMSLVGPRPIVTAEIVKYGHTFREYLRVTPGITGLWQISGRNNTTYAERLAYDEFYVRNWSPWLDLYILLRTIRTVILCEGAY